MSAMDPAFKRQQFEQLKRLNDQGRLVPVKRKKFTAKERAQVHADYEGRCRACDRSVGLKFHVDHRIPLFRGGKHERANWGLLCIPCHAAKTRAEAPGNAKCRRIEDRELNGAKPATLQSRNDWPAANGFRRDPNKVLGVDGKVRERSR